MKHAFRALRHRNFAVFFAGQGISLLGYWIQQLALNWMVYRLTDSTLLLGITSFASNIPILLLAPVAGIVADRVNLKRAMIVIQALESLQAIALLVLTVTGLIQPWHIVVLAVFMGACVAFELPVRHAFMPDLVPDRADLPNAIALTSFVSNGGRLIGPAIAGIVVTLFSEAACFLINTLTFVGVLWSLAALRVAGRTSTPRADAFWPRLREGAVYAWHFTPIRTLLLSLAAVSFVATPYSTLMPAIARDVYHGNADTLGFLVGSAGCGAFLGTGFLAWRSPVRGLVRGIAWAAGAAGAGLMALSFSRAPLVSAPLLVMVGFGMLVTSVSVSIIIQSIVADDKRGRVMSFYTVAFLGVSPLGALAGGALAEWIGATNTILVGGICCTVAALNLFRVRSRLAAEVHHHADRADERAG